MVYGILRFFLTPLFRIVFRLKVTGIENLPASGGYIIASNHVSLWDPPVLASPVIRNIHYMAKQELFEIPLFAAIIRAVGTFPVKRGTADRNAIRTAISLLKAGEVVGIFPEGTRSKTGKLQKAEPGLELIAARAGVPVIPVALIGTNCVFHHGCLLPQFSVHFGAPLYVKTAAEKPAKKFGDQIMEAIQNLLDAYGKPARKDL